MRVLQLISSAGLYGAEHMMLTLSETLTEMGHQCTIGVFKNYHRPNLDVAEKAKALRLSVELIPCKGRADFRPVARLCDIVRTQRINVLHTHGYKADIYGCAVGHLVKVSTVSTCHNWLDETSATRVYAILDRWALQRFHAVAAVSAQVAEILLTSGVSRPHVHVIPNGIKIEPPDSARSKLRAELAAGSEITVGFVGRLSPEKGVEHLLRAAALVRQAGIVATFFIVGDGPEATHLKEVARELGIAGDVHFLGARRDMGAMYALMDILILPSLTEGLPLTLLEALAAKRAVVGTRVGGIPEVIGKEERGLLVGPGSARELSEAIVKLAKDPELRSKLGESGNKYVSQHYSARTMAERYAALYSEVTAEHNGTGTTASSGPGSTR